MVHSYLKYLLKDPMIKRTLSKLIFYTLVVFFSLPICYLYASKASYKMYVNMFHHNVKHTINNLNPDHYYIDKSKCNKNIRKKLYCAFWLIEEEVCFNTTSPVPIGFNIRCISDDPIIVGAHSPNGYNEINAIAKWDAGQGYNPKTGWYDSYDNVEPLSGGNFNLHSSIKWLSIDTSVRDRICLDCHTGPPKRWIFSYRYYYPN